MKKFISVVILLCFIVTSEIGNYSVYAQAIALPTPGTMVNLSPAFEPVLIKGLKVHPENPFLFDFIIDTGNSNLNAGDIKLKEESNKLIKYFLASLTVPEKDLWVNLSPYEKDRMIAPNLGQTEMGHDMLAQDYILKQLTASLIYPERNLGKTFWDDVYAKARLLYGTSNIPVNTFNKVWIVADKADVFERGNVAYVVGAHLKVMLEEDYLALSRHSERSEESHSIASRVIRQIILPQIEKEVNTAKNFAPLRQMFYSMILASWYKMALKDAILTQIYGNKSKVKVGINQADPKANEAIFDRYLQAYKKGVFNYIKDDVDQSTNQTSPKKYFSGGEDLRMLGNPVLLHRNQPWSNNAMTGQIMEAIVDSTPKKLDRAMQVIAHHFPDGILYTVGDTLALDEKGTSLTDAWHKARGGDLIIKELIRWKNMGGDHSRDHLIAEYEKLSLEDIQRLWNDLLQNGNAPISDGSSSHKSYSIKRNIEFSQFLLNIKDPSYLRGYLDRLDALKSVLFARQNCKALIYVTLVKHLKLVLSDTSKPLLQKKNNLGRYAKGNESARVIGEDRKPKSIEEIAQDILDSGDFPHLSIKKDALLQQFHLNIDDYAEPGPIRGKINLFIGDPVTVYSFSQDQFLKFFAVLQGKDSKVTKNLIRQIIYLNKNLGKNTKYRELGHDLVLIMSKESSSKIDAKQLLEMIRLKSEYHLPFLEDSLMLKDFELKGGGHFLYYTVTLTPSNETYKIEKDDFIRWFISVMQRNMSLAQRIYQEMSQQVSANQAMKSHQPTGKGVENTASVKGGIDLSHSRINVSKEARGVQMRFDPAMIERIKHEGFDGLDFQIERIIPVTNLPLWLGLKESEDHYSFS